VDKLKKATKDLEDELKKHNNKEEDN